MTIVPGTASALTFSQAPAGLQVAVRSALGSSSPPPNAIQKAELAAADGVAGNAFGTAVAVSGSTAVVGAPNANGNAGVVYVFVKSGSTWLQDAEFTAADMAPNEGFGSSVAISGSTMVVGAPGANSNAGAAYVFSGSGSTWTQEAKLTASDTAANDLFGHSVAVSRSIVVVGAPGKMNGTGAAYVFVGSGSTWTQQAELPGPPAPPNASFGWSVAVSGTTAFVGAPANQSSPGAAYVFAQSGSTWPQQAVLTDPAATNGDSFGFAVAGSGSTLVVGAPNPGSIGTAAYVFAKSGSQWLQQAELTPLRRAGTDQFGSAVAISSTTVLVGAPGSDSSAGAAYMFVKSGSSWSQTADLTASDAAAKDQFGAALGLSGSTALVGAPNHNSDSGAAYVFALPSQVELAASDGVFGDGFGLVAVSGSTAVVGAPNANSVAGAAYVFVKSGSKWVQEAKLTASDSAANASFGNSVAISGSTVVVGAPNAASNTGAAYVFVGSGSSWTQQAKLTASDAAPNHLFGFAVAVSGSTAVVGAPQTNSSAGAAYVFAGSGSSWSQQAKLTASDAASGASFGFAVGVSTSTAVVGALNGNSGTGSAYVFVKSGSTWLQQAKLTASDAAASDQFGFSVAVSGSTLVVGAPTKNSSAGKAYVFAKSGSKWPQQAELTALDAAANDQFGFAVAISGPTVLVGAPAIPSASIGAAYVFVKSGSSWSQQAKLTAPDAVSGDQYGLSVALSGSTGLVGAPNGSSSGAGAAYVLQGV